MYRVDHATAAPGNLFTEGSPSGGVPATIVPAAWLNDAVQEELVNLVEAADLVLSKPNNAQVSEAVKILASGAGGFSNQIINGGFNIYQRDNLEVVFAGTPEYVLDRWRMDAGGGAGQATITRLVHTVGQTDVPGNPRGIMRIDQTVAATSTTPKMEHRVERVRLSSGSKLTLDLWAKVGTATLSVTPRLAQNFGVAGSAQVDLDGTTMNLTTTWQRFTRTFDLASVSGKTINADNYLGVEFILPTGQLFVVDMSQCQLTEGASAPTYQERPEAIEAALCYRFYEKSYAHNTWNNPTNTRQGMVAGYDSGFAAEGLATRFRVEKRAAPTVVWIDPFVAGTNFVDWNGSHLAATDLYSSTVGVGAPTVGVSQSAGPARAHWEADSEL